jgi:glycosyltransferase involved in cell wall biosynthesis
VVAAVREIAFDALFLDPGVSGGPETVLRGLVPAIAAAAPELDITVVTSRRGARALRADSWTDFARIVALPCDDDTRLRKLVMQQLVLARLARERGWDLVHSLSNLGPVRTSPPLVLTVYDVIFLREATMSTISRISISAVVRAAAPRAAAVVTMSAASRAEIVEDLRVDPDRVFVVPAPGRPPGPSADAAALGARLGLEGRRVVLNVAAKRTHKNQALLVRALERLPADVALVLAGHDGGEGDALRELAAASPASERIVQLEYVPDDELEALYELAACVALPTRAEGYGLPVLEAMQRGTPVACSDLPVLREIGGDAAAYFDPGDAASAAAAIERVLADPGLPARSRAQAAGFSWESAARRHLEIYERCTSA